VSWAVVVVWKCPPGQAAEQERKRLPCVYGEGRRYGAPARERDTSLQVATHRPANPRRWVVGGGGGRSASLSQSGENPRPSFSRPELPT